MGQKLTIVMIASEAVPYAKTGGLADVVGTLPKALKALGHEVIVILPKYSSIDYLRHGLEPFMANLGVWMGGEQEWAAVHAAENDGVSFYFIESHKYFDRWGLYHDADYNDYLDNGRRFGFLARAGLQLTQDLGFKPDIVHVHDWQTALAPAYLKTWHWNDPLLGGAASVLTIHNIAYQGVYDAKDNNYLGLQAGNFTADKFEDYGRINFLKGGIVYADAVNTVSPTYANETRTPMGGMGLAPYLNNKGANYVGILNGCDYNLWNPEIDALIPARYSAAELAGKAVNKARLQARFLLEINPNIPLIGSVGRLASQKGMGLLASVIEEVCKNMLAQFIILGSGEKSLESFFGDLPARYPGQIGSFIGYSNELSHLIEAGSDFFVMPSLYEPCGLNQMYSLRYGTPPIVRATGGLEDTVQNYNETDGSGNGFKFWEPTPSALYYTLGWAISTYFDRPQHLKKMVLSGMAQDFSWERSARAYEALYRQAMRNKAGP
jgi:starch synthase